MNIKPCSTALSVSVFPAETDPDLLARRKVLSRLSLGAIAAASAPWVMMRARAEPASLLCPRYSLPVNDQGAGLRACVARPNPDLGELDYKPTILDPWAAIPVVISGILGEIPVVGPLLSVVFNLLWPQHAAQSPGQDLQSLWDKMLREIKDLIDVRIEDFYQGELSNIVTGLQTNLNDYRGIVYKIANGPAPTSDLVGALQRKAGIIHGLFESSMPQFTGIRKNGDFSIEGWKVLPLYVQAANLHIAFLYDLIQNAASYGITQAWLDDNQLLAAWSRAIDPNNNDSGSTGYLNYVSSTLTAAFAAFESEYQTTRAQYNAFQFPNDADDAAFQIYNNQHGGLVSRCFGTKKIQNDKINRYTITVQDVRDVWKKLPAKPWQKSAPITPVVLDRVLWCGPYGAPDAHDIGIQYGYHKVSSCAGYIFCLEGKFHLYYVDTSALPQADVPMPPATPDKPLSHIHFDGVDYMPGQNNSNGIPNFAWHLPANHSLNWGDAPTASSGYNIAIDPAHPISSVNIHTCDYSITGDYWTAGTLIGGIEFVQDGVPDVAPPTPPDYQDWPYEPCIAGRRNQVLNNCCDGTGFALHSNGTQTARIDSHVLCNMFRSSQVTQMWQNLSNPSAGNLWSAGTMMFAFRLKNPLLSPTVDILASFYVTDPKPKTAADLATIGQTWYANLGIQLTAADLARMTREIQQNIDTGDFAARRTAYWRDDASLS